MNSRERVLAAIRRTPADRIAVGGMGFEDETPAEIRQYLGAAEDADLADLLGLDLALIAPAYVGPAFDWKPENRRLSFFGSSDKTYADEGVVERPLRRASSMNAIEAFRWPTIENYDMSGILEQCNKAGDRAICSNGWTPTFSQLCELFGMETALCNLVEQPAMMQACAEHIADLLCDMTDAIHRASAGKLLIVATADDVATNRGLLFSPDLWRELFKPSLARQFAAAKKHGLITWFHSCGDVSSILGDLVDIGLDVLEPTQAHLPGMNPKWLKKEFGKQLTFFGGISTQTTLPFGTPEQVRLEVRQRIEVLGEGGGYIVAPDHTVLAGMPAANVVALYEEAGSLKQSERV